MGQPMMNQPVSSRQTGGEPLFVAVPPRPQRLLHSEAYIKYCLNFLYFNLIVNLTKLDPIVLTCR